MPKMSYLIHIGNYRLNMVEEVIITKDIQMISDTASIKLPGSVYGKALKIENTIKVGDAVSIELGYDNTLEIEFKGYLKEIKTDDGSIILELEDDAFLARKILPNKVLRNTNVREILTEVIKILPSGYRLPDKMSYERDYESFVIHNISGYELLKILLDDCKVNIYFKDQVLYCDPPFFFNSSNYVTYDFEKNIEKSELKYQKAADKKYQVTVKGYDKNSKLTEVKIGDHEGDHKEIIVTSFKNVDDLRKQGEIELSRLKYDGYEGNIIGWLVPYVDTGYGATIIDRDYEYKNGTYFVNKVITEFSANGGVRKVYLGKKLA